MDMVVTQEPKGWEQLTQWLIPSRAAGQSMYGDELVNIDWCAHDALRLRAVGIGAVVVRRGGLCAVFRSPWVPRKEDKPCRAKSGSTTGTVGGRAAGSERSNGETHAVPGGTE